MFRARLPVRHPTSPIACLARPLALVLLLLTGLVSAAEGLPTEIDKALRLNKLTSADLSLYVREVTAGAPRLAHNTKVPRIPASTIKLLTTIVALDQLGPTYRWQTRAYLDGGLTDGHLDGDLIIQGGGGPSLGTADLWRFLWTLRERGLRHIGGDLLIDASAFAGPEGNRDAFDGDGRAPYNALPVAFAVNDQATEVTLVPDRGTGEVRAYIDPPLAHVSLDNQLRLVDAPCRAKDHRIDLLIRDPGPEALLTLSGTFADDCGEDRIARLVLDPVTHAGNAVLALWAELGGTIDGVVRAGSVPSRLVPFHRIDSDPLALVVRAINKESNNLLTRTLFLTLGLERFGAPATAAKGQQAVRDWRAEKGLEWPELVIENGSGLSRAARISADSMAQLLGWVYANPAMAELTASLPIVGVDGTLESRLRRDDLRGRAHLKTGSLRGATGLAGFVEDAAGRRWILVSLINNPTLQGWRGKAVEDAILRWVYDAKPMSGQANASQRP